MQRYIALQKILEFGSFTRAAEFLGYTQSSISQMIASLENELSMKLLIRSRYGVKLTIEGAELYPYIEKTINQYTAMQQKAGEIRHLETGVVRVGTISSITCHWMPQLIRGFQQRYPHVQFVFHQGDYTTISEWVRSGAVDFGFVSPDITTDLQLKKVKNGEMLAILPAGHPLACQDAVPLADLAKEPFILLETGRYSEPLDAFRAQELKPDIQYIMHDDYAIMTMVEAGLGVSILAELMIRRTNFDIAALPLDPPLYRTIAVCYKDRSTLSAASQYFMDYLFSHIDELP